MLQLLVSHTLKEILNVLLQSLDLRAGDSGVPHGPTTLAPSESPSLCNLILPIQ